MHERTLVLFDVDGTLCDTCDVDGECFLRAAGEALGETLDGVEWAAAPQITDSGVLDWLWRRFRGRPPAAQETRAVADRSVGLLREEHRRNPARFRPIEGAREVVSALRRRGVPVAAATGGWTAPARFKLEAAGIGARLLLASSDDSADRAAVFRLAAERAGFGPGERVDAVVLLGDGAWDVAVARHLRWRFVGIGRARKADRLVDAGASIVLPDFQDLAAVERAIVAGAVPGRAAI